MASEANGGVPAARSVRVDPSEPIDLREYSERWHKIWADGLKPGQRFDAGECSPLLLHLLSSGEVPAARRRALVPGCGRGYDVLALARAGASLAVGLDISADAVVAAAALRDELLAADTAARAVFERADFFSYKHKDGPFDLGYDYTFMCALPPQARKAWADAWASHLAPGAELVALIFPVDPEADANVGPPFPVTPAMYDDLLTSAGFERIKLERVPEGLSHKPRAGREWLGRWRWPGPPSASSRI